MAENEPEITTEEEVRTESIPFETIRQDNPEIEQGNENIVQEGQEGERTITEEVTYEDGNETAREEISNEITTEPIDEIIDVGIRVIEEETTTEPVPFETERRDNSELEEGTEEVVQEGVEGQRTIVESVSYVDGEEVSREEISNEITTEPTNEIIDVGTFVPAPENNKNNRRNKKMAIVWRDKVLSSYNGNIESVVIYDANGENQVEVPNGVFVTLNGLEGTGREVKQALLAEDPAEDVLLVASPEVVYEANKDIADFVNEEGSVARAFRLADGDVISLTDDLIADADTIGVGDTLAVGEGGKLTSTAEGDEPAVQFVVREDAGYELHREAHAWRFDVVK